MYVVRNKRCMPSTVAHRGAVWKSSTGRMQRTLEMRGVDVHLRGKLLQWEFLGVEAL